MRVFIAWVLVVGVVLFPLPVAAQVNSGSADLAPAIVTEATPSQTIAPASTTVVIDTALRDALRLSGAVTGGQLTADLTNISTQAVRLYFETCGICYWKISVNNGPWQMLQTAMHCAPCPHKNIVSIQPGHRVQRPPQGAQDTLHMTPGTSFRVRYQLSDVHDRNPIFVESDPIVFTK